MVLRCPPLGRGCTGRGEKRCLEGKGRAEQESRPQQSCLSLCPPHVPSSLGTILCQAPLDTKCQPREGTGLSTAMKQLYCL